MISKTQNLHPPLAHIVVKVVTPSFLVAPIIFFPNLFPQAKNVIMMMIYYIIF